MKTLKKISIYLIIITISVLTGMVIAGTLDPIDLPDNPGSAMYTLTDLYNRLVSGTESEKRVGGFTEPQTEPGATGHTLDEIMAEMPQADNTDGAVLTDVADGKTFWGLNEADGTWGARTGTTVMPEEDNTDGAVPADVLKDKTYWGLTTGEWGEQTGAHECIPCNGTLVGTRWCDNGDGTVTDLLGYNGKGQGLVWLKDADWGGEKAWRINEACDDEGCHDDANTRVGTLRNGLAGLTDGSVIGDWQLPSVAAMTAIAHGIDRVGGGAGSPFTGMLTGGYYWTSTVDVTKAGGLAKAAAVRVLPAFSTGQAYKFYPLCVWAVRSAN